MSIHLPDLEEINVKLDIILNLPNTLVSRVDEFDTRSHPKGLLDVNDVAEYLGVSRLTVYKWTSARELHLANLGARTVFRSNDIEAWIEGRRTKSIRRQSDKIRPMSK